LNRENSDIGEGALSNPDGQGFRIVKKKNISISLLFWNSNLGIGPLTNNVQAQGRGGLVKVGQIRTSGFQNCKVIHFYSILILQW